MVLTGAGRGLSLTERTARRLPRRAPVLELDVTRPEQAEAVRGVAADRVGPGRRRPALHRLRPAGLPGRRLHGGQLGGRLGGRGDLGLLAEDAGRVVAAAR